MIPPVKWMNCIYIQLRSNAPVLAGVDAAQMLEASIFEVLLELTDTTHARRGAHFLP
jgi:hypothetical protein